MGSNPHSFPVLTPACHSPRIREIRNLMPWSRKVYPLRFRIFSLKDSKEFFVPKSSVARHWEEIRKGRKHRNTRAWFAWSEAGLARSILLHCSRKLFAPISNLRRYPASNPIDYPSHAQSPHPAPQFSRSPLAGTGAGAAPFAQLWCTSSMDKFASTERPKSASLRGSLSVDTRMPFSNDSLAGCRSIFQGSPSGKVVTPQHMRFNRGPHVHMQAPAASFSRL